MLHSANPLLFLIKITLIVFTLLGIALWPDPKQPQPTALLFGPRPSATASPTLTPTQTVRPSATLTPSASPTTTSTLPPTATATPQPTATETSLPTPPPLLIGAGDIAYCGEQYQDDEATARIIEGYPEAAVFTAGDNQQDDGGWGKYDDCYHPSWGRFKERIHPSLGNHDDDTDNGAPYYAYFGAAAGEPGRGYYSYNLGEWHIVALNSNCPDGSCEPGTAQEQWLRADLAASGARCTLLYWHHPRWTSGPHPDDDFVAGLWNAAFEGGAEIVINGHNHQYERFAPMDGAGNSNPDGVREFVVGTGGAPLYNFITVQNNSEVQYNRTHGVILFRLYSGWYEWEFIDVNGDHADNGTANCH